MKNFAVYVGGFATGWLFAVLSGFIASKGRLAVGATTTDTRFDLFEEWT